jgi:DNA-binding NarL/FixJ family response regulator
MAAVVDEARALVEVARGVAVIDLQPDPVQAAPAGLALDQRQHLPADAPVAHGWHQKKLVYQAVAAAGLDAEAEGQEDVAHGLAGKAHELKISETLGEKITNIFKQKQLSLKNNNSFFTERENQVLTLSMEGLPIKIIADKLSISDRTVEKHRTKLMEKSGSSNMIEVIIFALRNSLVEI